MPTIFIPTSRRTGKLTDRYIDRNCLKLSSYLPNKQLSRYKDGRHRELYLAKTFALLYTYRKPDFWNATILIAGNGYFHDLSLF